MLENEIVRNALGIVASYAYIAVIILLAKLFERFGKEASRKFVHIMLANWWFIAMFFFTNAFTASFVPLTFVVINYLSYKKDIIKVMERDDNEKEGLGTVYYAISLFVLTIFSWGIMNKPGLGLCGVLVMGYGDGLAGIIGRAIKSPGFRIGDTKKTVAGSLTMLIVSFAIFGAFLFFLSGTPFWYVKAAVLAILATIIEAVSIKGTDNLTVPILMTLLIAMMA